MRALAVLAAAIFLSSCGPNEADRKAAYQHCVDTRDDGFWKDEGRGVDISGKTLEDHCDPVAKLAIRPETQECVMEKGNGHWVGSMGITLEKFCESATALQLLEQDRREHPENY